MINEKEIRSLIRQLLKENPPSVRAFLLLCQACAFRGFILGKAEKDTSESKT